MTGTHRQSVSSSTAVWRVALLILAVVLGLTNLVELAATFRPDYWDQVGMIGISGSAVNGKLRVSPDIDRTALIPFSRTSDAAQPAIEQGALVSVLPASDPLGKLTLAPSVLE